MENKEKIEYFRNNEEKELHTKILEYTRRVNDLGKQREETKKSRGKSEQEKIMEIQTIDNEAMYYIAEINKLTSKLYGGVRC